jgi:hypothetical protein
MIIRKEEIGRKREGEREIRQTRIIHFVNILSRGLRVILLIIVGICGGISCVKPDAVFKGFIFSMRWLCEPRTVLRCCRACLGIIA